MKRSGGKHPSGGRRRREGNQQNPLRDMVVAYVNARRPGPNPLDAYLDLRDPRPSVAKKPGRRKKKQGVWYIVDGDDYLSTGCSEKELDKANDVLTLHKNKRMEEMVGAHVPGALLFDEVLADHCANGWRTARRSSELRTARGVQSNCNTLLRYFAGRMISSYVNQDSIDFKTWFVEQRLEHFRTHDWDPEEHEPEQYATEMLRTLRSAVENYPGRHSQFWCIQIYVPPQKSRSRKRWLRKQEVIRLLLACRGYVWDWEQECWKTKRIRMPDGTWRVTRQVNGADTAVMRQGISRLIRFIIRTGMRHEAALLMKWGRWDDKGGIEFIDALGNGLVHRRGRDEYNTNKSLGTSEIFEELRVMLRIWAKQDGYIGPDGELRNTGSRGKQFLIRDGEGKAYDGYALDEFKLVREWAGLGDDVTIHPLKHTAATWCRQKGFSLEATAEMLDTSVETLRKFYTHVSTPSGTARQEFDDRAKRQAWRKVPHNMPEPSDPKRKRDKPYRPAGAPPVRQPAAAEA